MAFHRSNLGSFGAGLPASMDGYVPEAGDGPWDAGLAVDHGTEATHHADGSLTEHGEWWVEEGFPEWQSRAVEATEQAQAGLAEWQSA